jgi:uncharacterized repeat protein (TIGR01451 family)
MHIQKMMGILFSVILCSLLLAGLLPYAERAAAADTPDSLKLNTRYPVLKGSASQSFQWDIDVQYAGTETKTFDVTAKGPSSFRVTAQSSDGRDISAIRIDPTKSYGESIRIVATPLPWQLPALGDYAFTLAMASGSLKADIEVKATVTAAPGLSVKTPNDRLNADASAGETTHLTVTLKNTGTNDLKQISFSASKPDGWSVTFSPDKVDSLAVGAERNVEAAIKPSGNAISGDYMVNLTVSDNDNTVHETLAIRTTVLTSGIWGWVGIGIVVLVVVGLAFVFWKFGRR